MPRPEKVQAVVDIKQRLDGAQAVFVTEYAGLSVKEQQVLRRQLKASGAEMKVVKMTLARLAAAHMTDELSDLLFGPTALTFADGDPAAAAKALKAFAKEHDALIIKGGVLGEEFLSPERVSQLADLDPREVLLAKIAGAFAAPMAQMAGLLAALPRNAATVFQQLLEKKEEESPGSSVVIPQPEEESTESSVDSPQPEEESTESSVDSPRPEEESTESSVDSPRPEEETAAETEDAAAETEDAAAETEDAAAETEGAAAETEDAAADD
ncbi:MAG: 50S ribosomal protein L10 [Acidobacteria bacterium]|nr:50S ribosomal protein L10 [Acidobacteriota bacterium]